MNFDFFERHFTIKTQANPNLFAGEVHIGYYEIHAH